MRLIVCGAAGRMGSQVASLAAGDRRFKLTACVFHDATGDSLGTEAIRPSALAGRLSHADGAVDFSTPAASLKFAAAAAAAAKPLVIGTTGFSARELGRIKEFSKKAPIFWAPNFSPAIQVLLALASRAAKALPGFDASVWEVHHRAKKDSPSGTALKLVEAVRGSGKARNVPAVSQRLGDVVGEHTLTLAGPFERIELTHRAHSRAVFALGALESALWLREKQPGFYGMADRMGLP